MLDKKTLVLIGIGALFSIVSAILLCFVYKMSLLYISKEVLLAIITGAVFALPSAILLLIGQSVTENRNKRRSLFRLQQALTDIRQLVSDNADWATINAKSAVIQDCSGALGQMQNDNLLLPAINARIDALRNNLFTLNQQLIEYYCIKETNRDFERKIQNDCIETIDNIELEVNNLLGIITNPNKTNKQGEKA